jgi:hypothetical protein
MAVDPCGCKVIKTSGQSIGAVISRRSEGRSPLWWTGCRDQREAGSADNGCETEKPGDSGPFALRTLVESSFQQWSYDRSCRLAGHESAGKHADGWTASRDCFRVTFGRDPAERQAGSRNRREKYRSLGASGIVAIVEALKARVRSPDFSPAMLLPAAHPLLS